MRFPQASVDKRTVDGITFASKVEAEHYVKLKALQRSGLIRELQYEPTFRFVVNDIEICTYSPDFSYIEIATNTVHIQDVKGWKRSPRTGKLLPRVNREFHLKRNLMRACFGLDVELV